MLPSSRPRGFLYPDPAMLIILLGGPGEPLMPANSQAPGNPIDSTREVPHAWPQFLSTTKDSARPERRRVTYVLPPQICKSESSS